MNVLDGVSPSEWAYLIGALIFSIAVGVAVLVAIGTAEVRSRRGEAERVDAIRRTLKARSTVGSRS